MAEVRLPRPEGGTAVIDLVWPVMSVGLGRGQADMGPNEHRV